MSIGSDSLILDGLREHVGYANKRLLTGLVSLELVPFYGWI